MPDEKLLAEYLSMQRRLSLAAALSQLESVVDPEHRAVSDSDVRSLGLVVAHAVSLHCSVELSSRIREPGMDHASMKELAESFSAKVPFLSGAELRSETSNFRKFVTSFLSKGMDASRRL